MVKVIFVLAYLILAPFLGALLDGVDRIISARMQRRKGPKLLQPFYDLGKLFAKERIGVNNVQLFLNMSYLVILMIAGSMLFAGADLLMVLFILSTADMFLIMAASSDSSPYSNMGSSREMLQMMAYEPLTLLVAVGFYLTTGSFLVSDIIREDVSAVLWMPGLKILSLVRLPFRHIRLIGFLWKPNLIISLVQSHCNIFLFYQRQFLLRQKISFSLR